MFDAATVPKMALKLHDLTMPELLVYFQSKRHWYSKILSEISKMADPSVPTMCVGIKGRHYALSYHPEWFKYQKSNEILGVIEHECLHIILGHIPRAVLLLNAITDPIEKFKYKKILNVAMDLSINSILRSSHIALPDGGVFPSQFNLPELKSFEFYATELVDQVKVVFSSDGESVEGLTGEEVDDDGNQATDVEGEEGEDEEGEGEEGEGDEGGGEGEEGKSEEGEGDEKGMSLSHHNQALEDALNSTSDHNLDVLPDADGVAPTDRELEDLVKETEAKVREVVEDHADNSPSFGRGSIPSLIRELLAVSVLAAGKKWEDVIRGEVIDCFLKSSTYIPNALNLARLTMGSDIGLYGKAGEEDVFRVYALLDTSASMTVDQLMHILGVFKTVTKMEEEIEVRVIEYDERVRRKYTLKNNSVIDPEVVGRCGTNFDPVFKAISECKEFKPDLVINFTDGGAPPPKEQYRKFSAPLIWALTRDGYHPCPGYGKPIFMEV